MILAVFENPGAYGAEIEKSGLRWLFLDSHLQKPAL